MKNEIYVLSKEKWVQLRNEFKTIFLDKSKRPVWVEHSYGSYKVDGVLGFQHFILYALINNKSVDKVTHDIESENFIETLNRYFLRNNPSYTWWIDVFPSLTSEDFDALVNKIKK